MAFDVVTTANPGPGGSLSHLRQSGAQGHGKSLSLPTKNSSDIIQLGCHAAESVHWG